MSELGVEYGAAMVLVGPDGTRAVFNDDSDEDFVGILDAESSGLDSAEIREDAQDRTEADGGIHGDFYRGRRPVTLHGTIIASSREQRNERVSRLKRAANALRADATLTWEPLGSPEVFLDLRCQQPVRITKAFTKEFFVPMVSARSAIQGTTLNEKEIAAAETAVEVENGGNTDVAPTVVITGPVSNPDIINTTAGEELQLTQEILNGEELTINFEDSTILLEAGTEKEKNVYSALDFASSDWWNLAPGTNSIEIKATIFNSGEGANAVVSWRDAWE